MKHQIFKISEHDFIVPRSWITLHVSRLCEAGSHLKAVQPSDRKKYQQCLVKLTKNFCDILKWLDSRLTRNADFRIGNHPYKIALLQQRNAELLAVSRLNLGLSCADIGLSTQMTTAVNEVMFCAVIPSTLLMLMTRPGSSSEHCSKGRSRIHRF